MYPSEIGVVSCTKGFISISRTFIEESFIGNRQVDVKVKHDGSGFSVHGYKNLLHIAQDISQYPPMSVIIKLYWRVDSRNNPELSSFTVFALSKNSKLFQ
ncbi:MAG: hypothetical protein KKH20_03740, partial [Proteobacteria bacterium]|nr:hypothetical protein [Pseudomonadota bacterium]